LQASRFLLLLAPISTALLALACASPPRGNSSGTATPGTVAGPGGTYEGLLVIEGRPFEATLTLGRTGPRTLSGTMVVVSPVEIDGSVDGVVIDDLLRLIVTYEGVDGCDGTISGILDVGDASGTLAGPVTVDDCRGPVAGALDLRR